MVQYAILEWLWDSDSIRVNIPGHEEMISNGSYAEVVDKLSGLGSKGWKVVTCATEGNWLLWTLEKDAR